MKKSRAREREILDAAMVRLARCVDADEHNRAAAIEDLKFVNGEQWDGAEVARRRIKGRPALQFNLLPKFVDQVVNDMLENDPDIKIRPENAKADVNVARIRQGIINNIAHLSNFRSIKAYAAKQQVSCGYGAWRVLTRYCDENPFLQEAYIEAIRNPFLAYMDPDSKDQYYADAEYGFLLERMTREKFCERFPQGAWPSDTLNIGSGLSSQNWYDGDTLTVAEYFSIESEKVVMVQLPDGDAMPEDEFKEKVEEWRRRNERLLAQVVPVDVPPEGLSQVPGSPPPSAGDFAPTPLGEALPAQPLPSPDIVPGQPPLPAPSLPPLGEAIMALGPEPQAVKRRTVERKVVRHRVITALEILEGGVEGSRIPGQFIPVVVVKGKEINIEGKNFVSGLIRNAKDSQKAFNYWSTSAAEMIALAPKTPWLGTPRQFEGFENDYAAANTENFPLLKYNVDPEAQGPPNRVGPPQPPTAIFEQITRAEEMVKTCIGMFNADVGARGSEQTGAAILARQRPGDIGTAVFMVNMAGAVEHTGRIINGMIPEIYDTERDVRLRHIDETETFVPVNTTLESAIQAVRDAPEAYKGLDIMKLQQMKVRNGAHARFNDITDGKYGVVVTVGPSYATQRQESSAMLIQLMQSAPEQMSTALDLVVKNLDFKDADELEARLRKPLLAAGIIKPRVGEDMPPPAPPDPEVEAAKIKAESAAMVAKMRVEGEQQSQQMQFARELLELEQSKIGLQAAIVRAQKELGDTRDDYTLRAVEMARKQMIEAERVVLERQRLEHQKVMDGQQVALGFARLQKVSK